MNFRLGPWKIPSLMFLEQVQQKHPQVDSCQIWEPKMNSTSGRSGGLLRRGRVKLRNITWNYPPPRIPVTFFPNFALNPTYLGVLQLVYHSVQETGMKAEWFVPNYGCDDGCDTGCTQVPINGQFKPLVDAFIMDYNWCNTKFEEVLNFYLHVVHKHVDNNLKITWNAFAWPFHNENCHKCQRWAPATRCNFGRFGIKMGFCPCMVQWTPEEHQ